METKDKEWVLEASSFNQLGATAKMLCDILKPKGGPYAEDPPSQVPLSQHEIDSWL